MDPLDEISGVGLLYKREPGDLGRASTKRARLDKSLQYQSRDDSPSQKTEDQSFPDSSGDENCPESPLTLPSTPQSASGTPRHASDEKIHQCTWKGCSKAFNRPAKLAQHVRSHTNTRPFHCPYQSCGKSFLRDSHMKHHIKATHTHQRDYLCTWVNCGKTFLTNTRLKRHLEVHEGHNGLTCNVEGCWQIFRKHSTLQAHVLKIHEGRKPFSCAFLDTNGKRCGIGFDSGHQLRAHEGRMHQRKTFECKLCGPAEVSTQDNGEEVPCRAFPTYADLQVHVKVEHPPTCETCGLKCSTQAHLRSHIEVMHGDKSVDDRKTFICPELGCGRSFTRRGNMNVHINSIHAKKRYVCGEVDVARLKNVGGWDGSYACGMASTTKANLEEHIRTTHMGLACKGRAGAERKRERAKHSKKSENAEGPSSRKYLTFEQDINIKCASEGCDHLFRDAHEYGVHLQILHGLSDPDIETLLTPDMHEEVFARPSLEGGIIFVTAEDIAAEQMFDQQSLNVPGIESQLREAGLEEPEFWLGGSERGRDADEWRYDEQEIYQLIGSDDGEEHEKEIFDTNIDPAIIRK